MCRSKLVLLSTLLSPIWATETSCEHSLLQFKGARRAQPAVGGWCQAAWANKCTWGSDANVILPGGFQPDATVLPNPGNWNSQSYPDGVWLTIGGEGVGVNDPKDCLDIPLLVQWAEKVGATGLSFDMEGCLDYNTKLQPLMDALEKTPTKLQKMFVPLGDIGDVGPVPKYSDLSGTFDVAAPMFYWGATTYQGSIDCAKIKVWINSWLEAGWPQDKMYLTFQSQSAAADEKGQLVLKCLTEEMTQQGYLGLLGWPAPNAADNVKNMETIKAAMNTREEPDA